jgi:hypothetical protein
MIYRPGRAIYKQAAKSPELNMLDLGVWYHLHDRAWCARQVQGVP